MHLESLQIKFSTPEKSRDLQMGSKIEVTSPATTQLKISLVKWRSPKFKDIMFICCLILSGDLYEEALFQ